MKLLLVLLLACCCSGLPQQQHPRQAKRLDRGDGFSFPNDNDAIVFEEEREQEVATRRFERQQSEEEDDSSEEDFFNSRGGDERAPLRKEPVKKASCAADDYFCEDPPDYPAHAVHLIVTRLRLKQGGEAISSAYYFDPEGTATQTQQPPTPSITLRRPTSDNDQGATPQTEAFTPRLPSPQGRPPAGSNVVSLMKKKEQSESTTDGDADDFINGRINSFVPRIEEDSFGSGQADKLPESESPAPSSADTLPQGATTTTPTPPPINSILAEVFAEDGPVTADTSDTSSNKPEMFLQESPLCPTISRYVYPKRGVTRDETAKFIINSPETSFIQAVRVETCFNAGSSCSLTDIDLNDFGIRTVCRQKYTYRRMLAVSANGSEEVDFFKFPTACSCFQIEETPFNVGSHPFTLAEDLGSRGRFSVPLKEKGTNPRKFNRRN